MAIGAAEDAFVVAAEGTGCAGAGRAGVGRTAVAGDDTDIALDACGRGDAGTAGCETTGVGASEGARAAPIDEVAAALAARG